MQPLLPNKSPDQTRVVVAMSGGVDSSVTAALMHEAGYDVVGVTLQLYDYGAALQKKGACCAGQDIHDARRVAESLGIPHYVLNYESRFKESVMEEFADSYINGETPVPCVRCNQTVKFRDLFGVAKDLGADAMVTGHYVQRKDGPRGAELHNAVDAHKDQSYFLFATTQQQLDYLHFPLGGMHKEETRKHAERFGLEVADKPDSQDICFVPNGSYATVVERLRPGALDAGEIIHVDGTVLGTHDGIINYTIGQRKGLGGGQTAPLYVVKVEPETKRVIVGPEEALFSSEFTIHDVNWLGDDAIPQEGIEVIVKLRSAHEGAKATLFPDRSGDPEEHEASKPRPLVGEAVRPIEKSSKIFQGQSISVQLHTPERAVTPGQACVFYDGTRVLGGGWIMRRQENG